MEYFKHIQKLKMTVAKQRLPVNKQHETGQELLHRSVNSMNQRNSQERKDAVLELGKNQDGGARVALLRLTVFITC